MTTTEEQGIFDAGAFDNSGFNSVQTNSLDEMSDASYLFVWACSLM